MQPVQSFDTDMFRLFGQITGDPDFDLLRITAGTDFGMPSPGHTTLTLQAGGNWAVDSFFDITYRIDFVGHPGGHVGGMSGSTTGTIRMQTGSGVGCIHTPASATTATRARTTPAIRSRAACTRRSTATTGTRARSTRATGRLDFAPITRSTATTARSARSTHAIQGRDCACTRAVNCDDGNACTTDSCIQALVAPACIVPDNGGGTVTLPPAGCDYLSPQDVHEIVNGLPAGTTIELGAIHKDFICHQPGGAGVCSFLGVDCEQRAARKQASRSAPIPSLAMTLHGTGVLDGFNRTLQIPVSFETHTGPRTPGAPFQSFPTDMFRLFGQITGDPDFDLLRITAGTDFGMPSPGHTTLTQFQGGGNWAVDSFFDITYRIDFVGKPGGPFGGMSGSTTATIRMQTGSGVGCIHTPIVCNDNNPCTNDSCDPASGCVFTNNTAACDDNDPCTIGDVCGGGSCTGTPITAPPEVQNVLAAANKTTFTWSPATFATRYDVVRGLEAALPVGPGGADEVCFDNLGGPTVNDGTIPGAGVAFFYLSRGQNSCGSGIWGFQGVNGAPGAPRITTTCP